MWLSRVTFFKYLNVKKPRSEKEYTVQKKLAPLLILCIFFLVILFYEIWYFPHWVYVSISPSPHDSGSTIRAFIVYLNTLYFLSWCKSRALVRNGIQVLYLSDLPPTSLPFLFRYLIWLITCGIGFIYLGIAYVLIICSISSGSRPPRRTYSVVILCGFLMIWVYFAYFAAVILISIVRVLYYRDVSQDP